MGGCRERLQRVRAEAVVADGRRLFETQRGRRPAAADPATGVWVYDTYGGDPGFEVFGGTSVAAPIVGARYALAGNSSGASDPPGLLPYAGPALNDVTSGSNGTCGGSHSAPPA